MLAAQVKFANSCPGLLNLKCLLFYGLRLLEATGMVGFRVLIQQRCIPSLRVVLL
jgi:hypothetical protein